MTQAKKVDPLANIPIAKASGKQSKIDVIEVTSEAEASAVNSYSGIMRQSKELVTDMKPYRDTLDQYVRVLIAQRVSERKFGTFRLVAGTDLIEVKVPLKVKAMGEAEITALNESYGENAADMLVKKSEDKVLLNLDVWKAHSRVLIDALNATDEKGKRIVPREVVESLFVAHSIVPVDDLFENVRALTDNDVGGIRALLFDTLGVSPSLSVSTEPLKR